ncbi:MAG: ester cyclase [Caldilineaceae bacterium]
MSEQNKAAFRRMLHEVIAGGNLELIDELVMPDFVNYVYRSSGEIMKIVGSEAFRAAQAQMQTIFSNVTMEEFQMIAEGDHLVAHYRMRGVHIGAFLGVAATGKTIHMDGMTIVRFVDGKFAERRGVIDTIPLYKQLGIAP